MSDEIPDETQTVEEEVASIKEWAIYRLLIDGTEYPVRDVLLHESSTLIVRTGKTGQAFIRDYESAFTDILQEGDIERMVRDAREARAAARYARDQRGPGTRGGYPQPRRGGYPA